MWDQIEALWAAVRRLETAVRPLLPPEPPPPVPTEDPEVAKRNYEAAQAEVINQQERAALNVRLAQEAETRAKAILDASQAAEPPAGN